ncbi:hypothetical protein L1987_87888 [Smallanthus sonchifolius]|nr:hypothetical protein L1987_87888 [Smallanthus sonchifolius]
MRPVQEDLTSSRGSIDVKLQFLNNSYLRHQCITGFKLQLPILADHFLNFGGGSYYQSFSRRLGCNVSQVHYHSGGLRMNANLYQRFGVRSHQSRNGLRNLFLEDLLIQLKEVAKNEDHLNFEVCMDIMDLLLYEKEETTTLYSSPHSLVASILNHVLRLL